jgi:hypothetical protein
LLQTLGALAEDLDRDGLADRAEAVCRQGRLTMATFEAAGPLPEDLQRMRALSERHGLQRGPVPQGIGT